MARTTKQLSGGGKNKFLSALIAAEPSIPKTAAASLTAALCDAISDIRVRRDVWEPIAQKPDAPAGGAKGASAGPTPSATPPPEATAQKSAVDVAAPPAFDPFAFSALAVLTKQGAKVLAERLAAVATAEQLHAIAKAQHLSLDAGIVDPVALRAALVAATESRLAERRAAAS